MSDDTQEQIRKIREAIDEDIVTIGLMSDNVREIASTIKMLSRLIDERLEEIKTLRRGEIEQ